MSKDVYAEIDRDSSRERLLKYTRKTFKLLPKLDKPRILDAGCGSGRRTPRFWKKGFVLLQNEKLLFSQKSKTTTTTLSTRLILRKNAGLYFNLEVMASRLFAQSSRVPFGKDQLACGWYKLSMVMVLRLGAKCLRPDRMRLSM